MSMRGRHESLAAGDHNSSVAAPSKDSSGGNSNSENGRLDVKLEKAKAIATITFVSVQDDDSEESIGPSPQFFHRIFVENPSLCAVVAIRVS